MTYKHGKIMTDNYKVGDNIWAIYVDRCSGKSGRIHNRPPMLGKLIGHNEESTQFYWFVPYKVKRGKVTDELDLKKKIWVGKLYFADTYAEAAVEYNKFIESEISFHESKLESLKKCIISIDE